MADVRVGGLDAPPPFICPKLTAAYERMVAEDFDSWLRARVLDWRANVEEIIAGVQGGN